MKITVNGKETNLERELNITELLNGLKVEMAEYVTVQVNEEIISREDFESVTVKDGDMVEFLYFMGGGCL